MSSCARKIWDWELHYTIPNWDAILGEVNFDRRGCIGFFRHNPGRSPTEHLKLESQAKEFHRKMVLELLPLLYGTIGGIIGWLLGRRFH
jgi:hypothetical protein